MKKIRFAVVGTGAIAQDAFLPGLAKAEHAVLAAVVSGNPAKAAHVAAKFGPVPVFSYEQYLSMLKSGIVDAVYLALPNDLHAKFAIPALAAGVHALVEKPLATSMVEAEAMIAAAARGGAKLMTAYRLHCDAAMEHFMAAVSSDAIGTPRIFTSTFSFPIGTDNHRLSATAWGGPLQDVGVYCVNAARHVFKAEPSEVVAMTSRPAGDERFAEVDETVSAILRFPGDGMAVFSASFGADVQDRIGVLGTRGQIDIEGAYRFEVGRKISMRGTHGAWVKEFPYSDNFTAQADYFARCILDGAAIGPDGQEGLKDLKVMLAIEQAAHSGQAQSIR